MRSSIDPPMRLKDYVKERNRILLTKSPKELKEFLKRNRLPLPRNKATLEITWHKSITAANGLPTTYRRQSKKWLEARGYTSLDDGDL